MLPITPCHRKVESRLSNSILSETWYYKSIFVLLFLICFVEGKPWYHLLFLRNPRDRFYRSSIVPYCPSEGRPGYLGLLCHSCWKWRNSKEQSCAIRFAKRIYSVFFCWYKRIKLNWINQQLRIYEQFRNGNQTSSCWCSTIKRTNFKYHERDVFYFVVWFSIK
jgi:hypothetical protein